jgi:hypothetical protein
MAAALFACLQPLHGRSGLSEAALPELEGIPAGHVEAVFSAFGPILQSPAPDWEGALLEALATFCRGPHLWLSF